MNTFFCSSIRIYYESLILGDEILKTNLWISLLPVHLIGILYRLYVKNFILQNNDKNINILGVLP